MIVVSESFAYIMESLNTLIKVIFIKKTKLVIFVASLFLLITVP